MRDTLNGVKAKYNWGAPHWSNHSYSHWIGYCNLMQLLLSECAMKILLPFSFLIKKTPNGSHYFGCLKNWTSIVQVFHELSIILPMIFQYFPRYFPIVSGKIPSKNDISHDFPILSHDFPRYFHHPFPFRTKASGRCRLRVQVLGGDRLGPTTAAGACGDGAAEATPLPGQEIMVCSSVKIHIYLFNTYIYIIYVCVHTIIYEYIYICVQILKLLHDFWWAWHRFSMILDARPHRGAEVWICPWQLWAWRHLLGACWSIGIPLSNKAVVSKNNLDWCCPYCRQLCMKYMGLT